MNKVAVLLFLILCGCKNHPVDCAVGFHHDDCLPGTAGYIAPPVYLNGDAECKSYGLKFGTPAYAQCRIGVMQVNQTQQQNQIIRAEGEATRNQNSWNQWANSLNNNAPTHCHSQRLGSSTDTTCY